jgi:hypothetical protein
LCVSGGRDAVTGVGLGLAGVGVVLGSELETVDLFFVVAGLDVLSLIRPDCATATDARAAASSKTRINIEYALAERVGNMQKLEAQAYCLPGAWPRSLRQTRCLRSQR